jgi:hypothetical protein
MRRAFFKAQRSPKGMQATLWRKKGILSIDVKLYGVREKGGVLRLLAPGQLPGVDSGE